MFASCLNLEVIGCFAVLELRSRDHVQPQLSIDLVQGLAIELVVKCKHKLVV